MGHQFEEIPVSQLMLDVSNARLGQPQANQPAAQHALAVLLKDQLIRIAEDIVSEGLDPTTLMAVVPEGPRRKTFRVIEGNRRLLALKALETPAIVEAALTPARKRKLAVLSREFHGDAIESVFCVVFDTEEDARHWIELRHTGANGGVGLVEWSSDDQDRYRSRHGDGNLRSPGGQLIDYLDSISPPQVGDSGRILTNVQRLVSSAIVRDALGLHVENRIVHSWYPASEIVKCWGPIVAGLRSKSIKVRDIYSDEDRRDFLNALPPAQFPDVSRRYSQPVPLADLPPIDAEHGDVKDGRSSTSSPTRGVGPETENGSPGPDGDEQATTSMGEQEPGDSSSGDRNEDTASRESGSSDGNMGARRSRANPPQGRPTTIPRTCALWIPSGRINVIYQELCRLEVDQFSNACSVLLRVFLELSIDHHIGKNSLLTEDQRRSYVLAKRIKMLAAHLREKDIIPAQLEQAMQRVADGSSVVAASATTFNQYVHNPFSFPKASEVRAAWDELQPFMATLWRKGN